MVTTRASKRRLKESEETEVAKLENKRKLRNGSKVRDEMLWWRLQKACMIGIALRIQYGNAACLLCQYLVTSPNARLIDGIPLTKFDTIDDKVGAARSMVYVPGAPVTFVGCGQSHIHLKKLNINLDSAKGYKSRGIARSILGQWKEAAKDLHLASRIDYDEEIDVVLKKGRKMMANVMEMVLKLMVGIPTCSSLPASQLQFLGYLLYSKTAKHLYLYFFGKSSCETAEKEKGNVGCVWLSCVSLPFLFFLFSWVGQEIGIYSWVSSAVCPLSVRLRWLAALSSWK
ncbi:hypothetical protein IFM89_027057 [Coptis chinensis]|uniref:SRP54-type proteins GTP-binding domain-containing protein n=1 Tax=Coptis chinensis TaxID=261450 RepID=A0A835HYA1_9MAGN|nr:hypothetical protein IFM89_027057 [Coptis chinensis]